MRIWRTTFYQTQVVSVGPDDCGASTKRGALQTIRFDRSTLKAVDFDRSRGVIGQRHINGSLYVYLDDNVSQPMSRNQRRSALLRAAGSADHAYLLESRWTVVDLQRGEGRVDFTAQGFGGGDMSLACAGRPVHGGVSLPSTAKRKKSRFPAIICLNSISMKTPSIPFA